MRAGPTGVRYRKPGPAAYSRLLVGSVSESPDTLPKSKKPTAPSFPNSGLRISVDPSNIDRPPIGRPKPLNGLTSKRPHPRMLVAPPRKYRLKNGTLDESPSASIVPRCRRLAQTNDRATRV